MACTKLDCTKDNIRRNASVDVNRYMTTVPLAKGGCMPRGVGEIRTIFDFDKPTAALSFRTVNDTINGGGSSCELKYIPKLKCSNFFGKIFSSRGGGWASVRSPHVPPQELAGTHGMLLLSSSTDCNHYKITIKTVACRTTEAAFWHCDFLPSLDAGGCWRVTKLPFSQFSAVKKGVPHNAGGPLHPEV